MSGAAADGDTGAVTIRATFELSPPGRGAVLALQLSAAMARNVGPVVQPASDWAYGHLVAEGDGRAVVELDEAIWGPSPALLVAGLVAGEAMEVGGISRCRLVDLTLDVPDGWLPGPALGARPTVEVGVIVKPSVGLGPAQVAEVVRAAVAGGATFVKDDEVMADQPWCPLERRVAAVAEVLEPGVVYCANVTGSSAALVDRACRAVELGATGLMVDAFAQGLDSVLALRRAGLGVPVLAHRAGSGPLVRNRDFGAVGAVLVRLARLAGADLVIAGAFAGKLFETPDEVAANVEAARGPLGSMLPATVVLGGGLGPDEVARQAALAGGKGLVLLLGSAAYADPRGLEAAVRAAVGNLA